MTNSIITVPHNETVTPSFVEAVVRRDYCDIVTGNLSVDKFVEDNLYPYWLVINLWSLICQDTTRSEGLSALLMLNLQQYGLAGTIIRAASTADIIVRRIHTGEPYDPSSVAYEDGFAREAARLEPVEALQCLRFAKRFAPNVKRKYSKLSEVSIKKFLQVNADNKEISGRLANGLRAQTARIVAIAKTVIREIVQDFPGFNEYSFPRFGPGSVRNCSAQNYAKYEYLVQHGVYVPSHTVNLLHIQEHPDCVPTRRKHPSGKWVMSNLDRPHLGGMGCVPQVSRVTTVPKKVDAERIIAMEDPVNMSKQLFIKDVLQKRIKHSRFGHYMPIQDQNVNRIASWLAVVRNNADTVDLSHASDSVLKVLVQMLFPDDWWRAFASCIPTGFILQESDSGPQRLNCFATMGCGCTFVVETLVFYSLQVACWLQYHSRNGSVTNQMIREGNYPTPDSIYSMGDDCIRPSYLGPLIDEVLKDLGFSINHDKTFTNGLFRESCGAEWLKTPDKVLDVTSVYWPRIPVKGNWDAMVASIFMTWRDDRGEQTCGLSRLIDLQHRLFFKYPKASEFLSDAVRTYAPYMTASEPNTVCSDLWSFRYKDLQANAVYVGGSVNKRFRQFYTLEIPDGYVEKHSVSAFLEQEADEVQSSNILDHRLAYNRDFHLRIKLESAIPQDGVNRSLLDVYRLERTLSQESDLTGFPDIILGDTTVNLAKVLHLRPWRSSYDGAFGVSGVTAKLQ